jgi:hypothetical protein
MKTARILIPAGLLAATALALAGCATSTPIIHGETLKPTPTTTASPSTPATALPALTSAGSVPTSCADLAPGLQPSWSATTAAAPAGSTAAAIAAAGGIACGFQNASGQTLEIAMLEPTASTKTALGTYLDAGYEPMTGAGNQGWFRSTGGVGDAEVFAGTTWLSATSNAFTDVQIATDLMVNLTGQLPS